ncbi:hypothetical protein ACRALDRAFT_1061512 [Sodiomyces alcalophilus JCM 7366]|uniref:uncharacterized protein n=1 Tax=Sodiomyces alcalophilus JCM 7366 TaxID=591952 RepID=UPI0039B4F602
MSPLSRLDLRQSCLATAQTSRLALNPLDCPSFAHPPHRLSPTQSASLRRLARHHLRPLCRCLATTS